MMKPLRLASLSLAALMLFACSAPAANDDAQQGDDQEATGAAAIEFRSGFETKVTGSLASGKAIRVAYALDRLPQCRGNVGGGGPGWNVTGWYSENGGEAKSFEVSALSPDGKDRVAKDASLTLTHGGDLAVWFQVSSRWGCNEYDSNFGQNFHFDVKGDKPAEPTVSGTIEFGKSGEPKVSGALKGGTKVKVRYAQERLDDKCYLSVGGRQAWAITGYSKANDEAPKRFETGGVVGSSRQATDAIVELPRSGKIALWFEATNMERCSEFDSKGGANYVFSVE